MLGIRAVICTVYVLKSLHVFLMFGEYAVRSHLEWKKNKGASAVIIIRSRAPNLCSLAEYQSKLLIQPALDLGGYNPCKHSNSSTSYQNTDYFSVKLGNTVKKANAL